MTISEEFKIENDYIMKLGNDSERKIHIFTYKKNFRPSAWIFLNILSNPALNVSQVFLKTTIAAQMRQV